MKICVSIAVGVKTSSSFVETHIDGAINREGRQKIYEGMINNTGEKEIIFIKMLEYQ